MCIRDRFIFGLGINEVGVRTATDLAKRFKTFENFRNATFEELTSVDGVGDVIANNIISYFNHEGEQELIKRLLEFGVNTIEHDEEVKEGFFTGKTVVITGTFSSMKRDEIKAYIEKEGGKATSSVSKNTDLVLVGENPGSKLDKANELEIEIMNENELMEVING